MENLGIVVALGAAIAWGIYPVPFKISKSENLNQFQALTGVGIFLSGLIISLFFGYSLSLNPYGLLSGILWGTSNAIFLTAIFNLGLSKAVPIVSSLVILSAGTVETWTFSSSRFFLFHELRNCCSRIGNLFY